MTNLSIKVLGESCFLFEKQGFKLITDPWFGESIYGGAWSQFPIPRVSRADLNNITHIFISHIHADHFCIASIEKIIKTSPNVKFVILETQKLVSKRIHQVFGDTFFGTILFCPAYKEILIGDISCFALPPCTDNDLNNFVDSSLVLVIDNNVILFANDNMPGDAHANFLNQLIAKNKNLNQHLALIPCSGGSGYPASYLDITLQEKLNIAAHVRRSYEESAVDFLQKTSFDYYMPVAGNHIIVGRDFDWHNFTSFLLNPYESIGKINECTSSKGIYCDPGFFIDPMSVLTSSELEECSLEHEFQRNLFIQAISSRIRSPYQSPPSDLSDPSQSLRIKNILITIASKICSGLTNMHSDSVISDYKEITILLTSGPYAVTINGCEYFLFDKINNCRNLLDFLEELNITGRYLGLTVDIPILLSINEKIWHINEADASGLLSYVRNIPYSPNLYMLIYSCF